jgi:1,4-alpha-glucan branching enzyme
MSSTRGDIVRGWCVVFGVPFVVLSLMSCATLSNNEPARPMAVVFRLTAPDAQRVSVVGTFNGWDVHAHPLRGPDPNGLWSLSLSLPPGRYRYMFVVDGVRWVTDPNAVASEADGFGGHNSVLFHGR